MREGRELKKNKELLIEGKSEVRYLLFTTI